MQEQQPLTFSGKILNTAQLTAVSPRQAFYHLWLAEADGRYYVGKISGAGGRPWHHQVWEYETLTAAAAFFRRRLHQKTNPQRRSRRRYLLRPQLPATSGCRQLELPLNLE